jgi:CheY-like chemotaxis protein|tara:strand:- start:255 stop:683 length:429 start_codon:yes stop_codon:yes gene_type:complete
MPSKIRMIGIVDDDLIYQFMLHRIIMRNNLAEKIVTFSDGEDAIQYLIDNKGTNKNIPDVIFLDTNMPILDGWQFVEKYAKIKAEIKKKVIIYMLSSSIKPADLQSASEISDLNGYIIKPTQLEELKTILHKCETFLKGSNS